MQRFSRMRLALFCCMVVILVAIPLSVLADTVTNDVGNNNPGTLSIGKGGTAIVSYWIISVNNDGLNGCNAADGSPATVLITITPQNGAPAGGLTANDGDLVFTVCRAGSNNNAQSITFTGVSPGTYAISASVQDNGAGTYNTSQANDTIVVTKANQNTLTVNAPASMSYGDAAATLTTSGGSGTGAVSYSVGNSSACSVSGDQLTATGGTGNCSVTATKAGDADFNDATSAAASVNINKAATSVSVTCTPPSVVYNGSAQTPCSATVTGPGGLNTLLTPVNYTANTNVGTATASASFGGNSNYNGSNGSATFAITQAPSAVTVNCPTNITYNGSAQTPCTATANGAGGLNTPLSVSYGNNTNAGTATANASYAGDANHTGSSGSATFTIDKASSLVTVTCSSATVTYDGSAQELCTATVSGVGGLSGNLAVSYADNVNAGTASASATFAGDDNHNGSSGSATFTIEKASSITTVTCPSNVTYTGAAQEPCSATASGAGGLNAAVSVSYADNVNAGTASASATFAGDDNHDGSSGSATFTIDKAPSTTTVTCNPSTVVYNGSAQTPCSASVSGVGGLDSPLSVSYSNNTNAGTATASASYAGDANHEGDSGSADFTISKAAPIVVATGNTCIYSGSPCVGSGSATGVDGSNLGAVTLTYAPAAPIAVGSYSVVASIGETANHTAGSSAPAAITVQAWTLKGFYAPVDMNGVVNTVKSGATVPLKFEIFAGPTELTNTSAVASFTSIGVACGGGAEDPVGELPTTGGTGLRYDTTSGQFINNWATPKGSAGKCYKVTMTTQDGSSLVALFKLK